MLVVLLECYKKELQELVIQELFNLRIVELQKRK